MAWRQFQKEQQGRGAQHHRVAQDRQFHWQSVDPAEALPRAHDEAASGLAGIVPQVVDKLSPQGCLPEGGVGMDC